MNAPNKKDVDAMSNLLKALSGDKSAKEEIRKASVAEAGNNVDTTPGVKSTDIKAMENILNAFNSASSNVAQKVATTISESKKTQKGVDIGLFSVENNSDGYFDIRDSRTNDTLFEDLLIYETAFIIAKHLNDGKKINSSEITQVMASNAVFEQYYNDALQHKHSYKMAKKNKNIGKMDIAEARFSRAKAEAGHAKKQIKNLYESIQ